MIDGPDHDSDADRGTPAQHSPPGQSLVHGDAGRPARADPAAGVEIRHDGARKLAQRHVADTATEVRARIRINHDTGTVEDGALWYEENLPGESVLWGVIGIGPARDGRRDEARANRTREEVRKIADAVLGRERIVQIGGKATVGRGLVRFLSGVE